jgi:hypothetical protein
MQNGIKYVPLESVITRVLEVLPKSTVNEGVLLEWSYEAYESIVTHSAYEKHVELVQVINHKASVPNGLFSLDMVMFTENLPQTTSSSINSTVEETTTVTTEVLNSSDTTSTVKTVTVSTKTPLNKPDNKNVIKGDSDGNLLIQDLDIYNMKNIKSWRPLPMSSNSYHNAILISAANSIVSDKQRKQLYAGCKHSFVINKGCFVTTFQSGILAVAYNGIPKDENGNYTIPDLEYVKSAIEAYCLMKYWQKRYNMMQDGAHQRYVMYKQEWQLLAVKASGELEMPDFMEYQNLRNINKFVKEDSPFATVTGASNNTETLFFGNSRNNNFYHN